MRIFGIDQTGAVYSKSKAKPLKACELMLDLSGKIEDIHFFEISHLGEWVQSLDHKQINHIFIDCVLGLPIELYKKAKTKTLRDWINKADSFSFEDKSYGRQTSQKFFDEILNYYNIKTDKLPRRHVEIKLNSNSVFTTHPFQKNIQTGTFRIWKELSSVLDSILLWPSDFYLKEEINIIFYEVYPSYFYKKLLNAKVRSPNPVLSHLKNLKLSDESLKGINNPDYCDALMAALGGHYSLKNEDIWNVKSDDVFFEGDILGSS